MGGAGRTIGSVLEMLRGEFPDITVSKVRYYERVGLITPARDPSSGYRVFRDSDINRLRYALRAQRDRYLPLEVIRAELEALDRGQNPRTAIAPSAAKATPPARERARGAVNNTRRWTRRELLEESGLPEPSLVHLERMKLISGRRGGGRYGPEAMAIAQAAARLVARGIDPRQLRMVQQSALAHGALLDQVFEGYPSGRGPSRESVQDMLQALSEAHNAYLHGQIANARWYRGIHDRA
ncbi:MAG TPA: MerR family transcriptional regulator [Arachnia sp.]|nr:MerR family transcriptional regulator [Arachnia sp.]HMT86220.1 MerR family transcriptional regulator [Arachnia sp.]